MLLSMGAWTRAVKLLTSIILVQRFCGHVESSLAVLDIR